MRRLKRIGVILILLLTVIVVAIIAAPSREISTRIRIDASPSQVWAVLTNLAQYPAWNQELRLNGALIRGRTVENIEGPGPGQMIFWPKILVVRPERELRWRGHLPLLGRAWLPGILDAEHYFLLQPQSDGSTLFIQAENLHGIVLWMFDTDQMLTAFAAMNSALKDRAEKASHLPP